MSKSGRWFVLLVCFLGHVQTLTAQPFPSEGRRTPLRIASIPVSATALTLRNVYQAQTDWRRRVILENFRKGLKGEPWNEGALEFVENAIAVWHSRDSLKRKALIPKARAAIDTGCQDPALIWFWARFQIESAGTESKTREALENAVKAFDRSVYPKAVGFMAAFDYREEIQVKDAISPEAQAAQRALETLMVNRAGESLTDGSYTADEDVLLVRHMLQYEVTEFAPLRFAAALEKSNISEWAKETLLGFCERTLAWRERGDDWGAKVTDAGWKGFEQHLDKAREHFQKGWQLRPDQPEAAAGMIRVVMAGHGPEGDTIRTWFDRSVRAQLDYQDAYYAMAWALRPRWGGSCEEMLAFGRACLATKRYDSGTPPFYFVMLGQLAEELGDWQPLLRDPKIASDLIDLDRHLLKEPQRGEERQLRLQFLGLHSFLAGKYDGETATFAELAGDLFPAVIDGAYSYGIGPWTCASILTVLRSPARDLFAQAEEKYRSLEFDKAEHLYRDTAIKVKESEPTAIEKPPLVISRRLAAIEFERDLSAADGAWKPLKPIWEIWVIMSGNWSIAPDGALVQHGTDSPAFIMAPNRMGENFEVRGEVEMKSSPRHDRGFGVVIAHSGAIQHASTACVWAEGDGVAAGILVKGWKFGDQTARNRRPFSPRSRFLIQVWNGTINFYLNDKPVQTGFRIEEASGIAHERYVGFGHYALRNGCTTILRNLEVRQLKAEPVPPQTETPAGKPSA